MQLSVMAATKRHSKFVADLQAQGSRLCELQVMGIGRLPSTDKTGLGSNETEMAFVAQSLGLANGERALVDMV